MKRPFGTRSGFTLIEMMVAVAAVAIVGGVFFLVTRNIAYLSAKNAAINLTHAQARTMIRRAVGEIRDSVSIPQLMDANKASLGGSAGPADGVSYQQIVAGPYVVWSTAAKSQNQLVISAKAGDPAPAVGMRLIVPAFFIEDNITALSAATGSPPVRTVTLANPLLNTITCTAGSPSYVAYYTQRSGLVVNGTDLRFYQDLNASTFAVVSSNITTPLPFSVPGGDNRFIQAAFATQDPRILARNFRSVNLNMSVTIPYRFRLTIYQ